MESKIFKLDNYFDIEVQTHDTGITLNLLNHESKIIEQKYLNVRDLQDIIDGEIVLDRF